MIMPRNKRIIPLSPLNRVFYNEKITRVSQKATERLADWVEDYARKLSKEAVDISKLSGRKTLMDNDFKTALKIIKKD